MSQTTRTLIGIKRSCIFPELHPSANDGGSLCAGSEAAECDESVGLLWVPSIFSTIFFFMCLFMSHQFSAHAPCFLGLSASQSVSSCLSVSECISECPTVSHGVSACLIMSLFPIGSVPRLPPVLFLPPPSSPLPSGQQSGAGWLWLL